MKVTSFSGTSTSPEAVMVASTMRVSSLGSSWARRSWFSIISLKMDEVPAMVPAIAVWLAPPLMAVVRALGLSLTGSPVASAE